MRETGSLLKLCAATALTVLSTGPSQALSAMDRGEADGLEAIAMAVLDPDVDAVWNIPSEQSPEFHVEDEIPAGSQVSLVVLFSPAEITDRPQTLNCYVSFFAYDAPIGEPYSLRPCYDRVPEGPADHVYMTDLGITFPITEEHIGVPFRIEVILEDPDRGISIPLEVSFRGVAAETQP
jgi:hypothetical protein